MAETVILTRSQYESLAGPITPEERRKYNGWEAAAAITDCLLNRRKTGTKQGWEMKLTQSEREAPALDAGLVDKMISVYCGGRLRANWTKQGGMTAALRVAADALLGPVTDDELHLMQVRTASPNYNAALCAFVGERRARLLAPAKTAEERVTVKTSGPGRFGVWLDDKQTDLLYIRKCDAEIYRLGLIATLKQGGK